VKRVLLLPEAREDVLDVFHRYESERKGLGKVFRAALKGTIEHIQQAPLASPLVYKSLRRALVERFPYAVFYRVEAGAIMVVGVFHGHREPGTWQRRG
jgi:toxin ParE1/3/4